MDPRKVGLIGGELPASLFPARSPEVAWTEMGETDLMTELAACILGSRVPFEMGAAAAQRLRDWNLLSCPYTLPSPSHWESRVYLALCEPLRDPEWQSGGKRYRFPRSRAQYLRKTYSLLAEQSVTISALLEDSQSPRDARRRVVSCASGIGPKQASLFLRNIGFASDLAILDSHVLRYMHLQRLGDEGAPPTTLWSYEHREELLVAHAEDLGVPLGTLDLAIWIVMRVASRSTQ